MSKDTLMTILGVLTAAAIGGKEYLAVQNGAAIVGSWEFYVGLASAIIVAALGYWAKKGE